ncbi:MAG TPA: ABC-F family ATP-binding cassette domain-containing protein [Bacillota bacterium]|nr:ABC-F family ATP-binding cassette domain-containing protein [Bacillota bacterium]
MLTVEQIQKTYGEKVLFDHISCTIEPKERIGLIGVNGTGKSTFLKVIAGIESPESGSVLHSKAYTIAYLAQDPILEADETVFEHIYYGNNTRMLTVRAYERARLELELHPTSDQAQSRLLAAQEEMDKQDAWDANTQITTILSKLGVHHIHQKVQELSGGQRKRVALAKALIQPADLLILDEPTNHLDNETIEWLEQHLSSYPGALLLVTHDRYFLNRVTNRIFELDRSRLFTYEGNYELFLEKKAEREQLEREAEQKHANLLKRELAWLQRGPRARSTKQKAHINRVEALKEKRFHTTEEHVEVPVGSKRLGKDVFECIDVDFSYKDTHTIEDFNFLCTPGDRIGIIGPNGIGKTTLLDLIAGRINPTSGEIHIGETVRIGYYRQGDEELDGSQKVIDYIKETAQVIYTKDGDPITAEQMLEHFLFRRSEQWNYIHRLSGGEKRRLYLLKVLMTEPNVLLLDEPTNDLDIQTLTVLEEYIDHFPGVVLTVSHDRYFLDRIAEKLLVFSRGGKVDLVYGNYSDFLVTVKETEPVPPKKKTEKKQQTSPKKARLSYHEKREWGTIEDEIMELEEKVEQVQEELSSASSDAEKVQALFETQGKLEQQLEEKLQRWEELSLIVEEMEQS